jgi:hypothetical protein
LERGESVDIKLTLKNKQLYPAAINLRQFSNNTDIIKFEMPDYMYETTDLSTMDCYAVCDMSGKIDEVKLETEVVKKEKQSSTYLQMISQNSYPLFHTLLTIIYG